MEFGYDVGLRASTQLMQSKAMELADCVGADNLLGTRTSCPHLLAGIISGQDVRAPESDAIQKRKHRACP